MAIAVLGRGWNPFGACLAFAPPVALWWRAKAGIIQGIQP